jgi:hypothetical protein
MDVAPTLARIAGLAAMPGADGRVLEEALSFADDARPRPEPAVRYRRRFAPGDPSVDVRIVFCRT